MDIRQILFRLSRQRVGIAATLLVVVIYFISPPILDMGELKSLDLRFRERGERKAGEKVVIVAIDEKSVNELGRWPWPRTRIAELLKVLSDSGAKTIGFDIVFSEPDQNSGLQTVRDLKEKSISLKLDGKLLNYLDRMEKGFDTDSALKEAVESSKRAVLGYFFHFGEGSAINEDDETGKGRYSFVRSLEESTATPVKEASSMERNIRPVSDAAKELGYFNIFPDKDGTIRWYPLAIKYGDNYYSPLALQLVREYLDGQPLSLVTAGYGVAGIKVGDTDIPSDEQGRLLINYYGPQKSFRHYSFVDVIKGRVPAEAFRDKVVIVGATEIGIFDMRVTPFESVYPGVEIHATVVENILDREFISRPSWFALFDLLSILFIGALLTVSLQRLRALGGFVITTSLMVGYFYFDRYLFIEKGLWLNIVFPFLTFTTVYTAITVYSYFSEEKEKKKVKGAFQYYVTASVMEEILKHPDKLKLGGDEKELSVLFSDIRGFTSISEKIPPEALVGLLNEYFTAMTEIVFKYEGYLDKYIGDAIMAVYGAPVEQEDHTLKACLTAIEMMDMLRHLQKKWESEGLPRIDIGIGINTGKMIVGNMGSRRRFNYTAVGDNVNLASRLEGLTKDYGVPIVISETVYEKVKGELQCRELGSVKVKGKEIPTKVYELIGKAASPFNLPSA